MKVLKKHLWRSVQSRSWGTHFCNPDDGQAKQHLGEILSAVEFMDRQSLDMVFSQQDWSKDPLENDYPEALQKVFDAHGGIDAWKSYGALTLFMGFPACETLLAWRPH